MPPVRTNPQPQKASCSSAGLRRAAEGQCFYSLCLPLAGVHLQQAVNGLVSPDVPRHGADGLLCPNAHHVGAVGASLHHSRQAGSVWTRHSGGLMLQGIQWRHQTCTVQLRAETGPYGAAL